jgi:hypothetical protein
VVWANVFVRLRARAAPAPAFLSCVAPVLFLSLPNPHRPSRRHNFFFLPVRAASRCWRSGPAGGAARCMCGVWRRRSSGGAAWRGAALVGRCLEVMHVEASWHGPGGAALSRLLGHPWVCVDGVARSIASSFLVKV